MTTITELVGRFGFEVDEAGFKKFESMIDRGANSLSGLLKLGVFGGIGYGLIKLFQSMGGNLDLIIAKANAFGISLDRALKGEKWQTTNKLIQQQLDSVDQFSKKYNIPYTAADIGTALIGMRQLTQQFGMQGMAHFSKIAEIAMSLANVTNAKFSDVFPALISGIESGNVKMLSQLPGITLGQTGIIDTILKALSGGAGGSGEIVSAYTIPQRLAFVENILPQILSHLPPSVTAPLTATIPRAEAQASAATTQTFADIGLVLKPVFMRILKDFTDFMNELDIIVNTWREKGFTNAISKIMDDFKNTSTLNKMKLEYGGVGAVLGAILGFLSPIPGGTILGGTLGGGLGDILGDTIGKWLEKNYPLQGQGALKPTTDNSKNYPLQGQGALKPTTDNSPVVNMNISFNINGAQDPYRIAVIAREEIQKSYMRAMAAAYPTESPNAATASLIT